MSRALGHTAYHHVGDDGIVAAAAAPLLTISTGELIFTRAAQGLAMYHGYKRNRGSLGWGLVWALLAGLSPVIVTGVALAQGVGHPKGK